jgi:predicted Zn-dependent protease
MVMTLGFTTFGALEYQEGRSFVCGKLGQSIVDPAFSLWDDGLAPDGLPMAFDFEGVPKQRVGLVEGGVAKGLVYDSYTAGREEGRTSTGHALPAPNPFGPIPMNLYLNRGDASLEEMVGETKQGIYVTRFHYTNTLDPSKTLWTGMTRDGTFLVEKGEIRGPVKNFRFTDGIADALASGGLVGKQYQTLTLPDWFPAGGVTVPAVKLNRYRFTGVTEF